MKSSVIQSNVYVNDQIVNTIQDLEPYTLYVNPYFVITEFSNADKVSKHYYMGTQRVASELAVQTTSYSPLVSSSGSTSSANSSTETFKTQTSTTSTVESGLEPQNLEQTSNPWLNNLNEALTEFGLKPLTLEETQKDLPTLESIYPDLSTTTSNKTTSARVLYWYHPDYIGNVDLVSDYSGEAYEFFLYNPWGENLYEWNSGTASFSSPYRFNGKELDQETGLAYYGARYYDNKISLWLSVDPLAHEYPSLNSYNFVANNPILLVDPNGESIWIWYEDEQGNEKSIQYNYGDQYDGDNQFLKDVYTSLNYLDEGGAGADIETLANDKDDVVNIRQRTGNVSTGSEFVPNFVDNEDGTRTYLSGGDINWNPDGAFRTSEGENSAAFVLGHEISHAALYGKNRRRSLNLKGTPHPTNRDMEENRVLQLWNSNSENFFFEGKRNNYYEGEFYRSASPTSTWDVNDIPRPVPGLGRDRLSPNNFGIR